MKDFFNTCKRLSNAERVDVLRVVSQAMCEEGLTVNSIADVVRLGQPSVSQYLKQLDEECGLVECERHGRYVLYRTARRADAIGELAAALRRHFRGEEVGRVFVNGRRPAAPAFCAALPGLANADRVRVLAVLRERGAASKTDLMAATKLTEVNVRRHVGVLVECGLASFTKVASSATSAISRIVSSIFSRTKTLPPSSQSPSVSQTLPPTSHIAISDERSHLSSQLSSHIAICDERGDAEERGAQNCVAQSCAPKKQSSLAPSHIAISDEQASFSNIFYCEPADPLTRQFLDLALASLPPSSSIATFLPPPSTSHIAISDEKGEGI